jgi:ribose transport system permease protein
MVNRTFVTILTILILTMLFGIVNPNYLSLKNLGAMLRALSYPGIIAAGVALCLIGGTMDLSVGAVAGFAAAVASTLMTKGLSVPVSLGAGVLSGSVVGYINSLLVLRLKLSTFIATIGMMFMVRGLVYRISRGYYIYPLPDIIATVGAARPLGVSWSFFFLLGLLLLFQYLLGRSVWGLSVRATGSDREVAFCTEVNADRVQTQLHVISGTLAAVAGLFIMCKIGGGEPTIGVGVELTVIASCAIGGVSLFGYEGSMLAVFLGLLFLQVVIAGIITSGVDPFLRPTAQGIIMLAAMVLDARESGKVFFRRAV